MKTIELTQDQVAIVDDDDFEELNQFKWYAQWNVCNKSFYADRHIYDSVSKKQSTIRMHRVVMGLTDSKMQVDHIYHNTLDNRKENLRIVTPAENLKNPKDKDRKRKSLRCSSIYPGVCWIKRDRRWRAHITINNKRTYLGQFKTELEAIEAVSQALSQF